MGLVVIIIWQSLIGSDYSLEIPVNEVQLEPNLIARLLYFCFVLFLKLDER